MTPEQRSALQQLLFASTETAHTLGEAILRYRAEHLYCDGLASNTIAWRERALECLARWSQRPIAGRWRDVGGQIYQEARARGLSEATPSLAVNTLGRILRLAKTWGWRSDDPDLQGLSRVRSKARTRTLSERDSDSLAAALDRVGDASERMRVAVEACRLALLTGWRVSEACGVEWQHVDGFRVHLPETKAGPQTRVIADAAHEVIERQPRTCAWVFPRRRGDGPLNRRQAELALEKARELAGLDGVVVHTLRHTFATRGAQLQLPTKSLSLALGHTCEWQTSQYQHVDDETVRAAANAIAGRKVRDA